MRGFIIYQQINIDRFVHEYPLLIVGVLGGLLVLFLSVYGLLIFNRWSRQRKAEIVLLSRTQESLKKLEELISTRDPFEIQNFAIFHLTPPQRTIIFDLLRHFEYFTVLRGYQSLLSFHSLPDGQVGIKFTIGESGIGVSAIQAKIDFDDFVKRMENAQDFEVKAIFLSPDESPLSRNLIKHRLNAFQKSYLTGEVSPESFHNILEDISERSFAPSTQVTGSRISGLHANGSGKEDTRVRPQATGVPSSGSQSGKPEVWIAPSFSPRYRQVEDLESLIPLLAQHPKTLHAAVWLEHVRNLLVEEDEPDRQQILEGFERANMLFIHTELDEETTEQVKRVHDVFHLQNLTPNFQFNTHNVSDSQSSSLESPPQ